MEEIDGVVVGSPRKRKGQNKSNYKVNKVKEARLKGQAYVNHSGREVQAKQPKYDCR